MIRNEGFAGDRGDDIILSVLKLKFNDILKSHWNNTAEIMKFTIIDFFQ